MRYFNIIIVLFMLSSCGGEQKDDCITKLGKVVSEQRDVLPFDKLYVEDRLSKEEIVNQGYDKKMLNMIVERIFRNHFKRKMPVIAKLTSRTLNHDFNYPRDIRL